MTCNINDIKTICCLNNQNTAITISTKYVNDLKCPFNIDSLNHKDPFNSLSSARSFDINRWHDKFLNIYSVTCIHIMHASGIYLLP